MCFNSHTVCGSKRYFFTHFLLYHFHFTSSGGQSVCATESEQGVGHSHDPLTHHYYHLCLWSFRCFASKSVCGFVALICRKVYCLAEQHHQPCCHLFRCKTTTYTRVDQ